MDGEDYIRIATGNQVSGKNMAVPIPNILRGLGVI
jgi:hypothetical protein